MSLSEITKKITELVCNLKGKDSISKTEELNKTIKEVYPIDNVIYNTDSLIFTFLNNSTITINKSDILMNGMQQSNIYMRQHNWLKLVYNTVTNTTKYMHKMPTISKEDEDYVIEYIYNLANTWSFIFDERPPEIHAINNTTWKSKIHEDIDKFIEDMQSINIYTFNPEHFTCVRDMHGIYIKYYDPEDKYNIEDEAAYKKAIDPWYSYFN
jgi:hypothetical protein